MLAELSNLSSVVIGGVMVAAIPVAVALTARAERRDPWTELARRDARKAQR